jgi:hypothetical protein
LLSLEDGLEEVADLFKPGIPLEALVGLCVSEELLPVLFVLEVAVFLGQDIHHGWL